MEKNKQAYLELIGSIDMRTGKGRLAMNLIYSTKSDKYPYGNSAQAWHNLTRKYQPKTAAELSRVKKSYVNARLRFGDDPDNFVDYLERLREQLTQMGEKITNMTFAIDLIGKLNNGYDMVIEKIQDMVGNAINNEDIDIETIKDRLQARYERLSQTRRGTKKESKGKNKKQDKDEEDESNEEENNHALYRGTFKGNCHKCGKRGHKLFQCPKKKKEIICYKCRTKGHIAPDCRMKKRNNETKKQESDKTNEDKAECVMTCMEIANVSDEIGNEKEEDRGIFIANTGASTHMIKSDKGMFDVEKFEGYIKIGNGQKLLCKKKGKIKVKVRQKNEKDVICVFEDVMFVPDLWVNLFSVGKALKHGWKLGSEKETMMIEKNGKIIRFDKILKTNNG